MEFTYCMYQNFIREWKLVDDVYIRGLGRSVVKMMTPFTKVLIRKINKKDCLKLSLDMHTRSLFLLNKTIHYSYDVKGNEWKHERIIPLNVNISKIQNLIILHHFISLKYVFHNKEIWIKIVIINFQIHGSFIIAIHKCIYWKTLHTWYDREYGRAPVIRYTLYGSKWCTNVHTPHVLLNAPTPSLQPP